MPKRCTLNEVKKYIFDIADGECKVLSDEYINNHTPLLLQCKCGNTFKRNFGYIKSCKNITLQCDDCLKKELSERNRESFNSVINYINSTGCEYISGDYINNNSVLKIKCRCGNVFTKKYVKFKTGQDRCQNCGRKSSARSKIKYTSHDVQKIVNNERGYNIDESKYIDVAHPVPCTCKNGHTFNLVFNQYLCGKSGCSKCAIENHSGSGHWNWKGGKSEVLDYLRKSIIEWKKKVLSFYDYKCAVTGNNKTTLEVHHLKAFSTIVEDASNRIGIPILSKISDYKDADDLNKLKEEIIKSHVPQNGIVISKDIHSMFHNIYGRGNNTPEQFDDFLIKNYNISLNDIVSKY